MSDLLGEFGPFAQLIDGFQPRPQQQAMLQAVLEALKTQATAVIEAGTGVGKTFAYLAPALLCDERVIISTGSKTLQDQLYHKDLPLVRKALKSSSTVSYTHLDVYKRQGRCSPRRFAGGAFAIAVKLCDLQCQGVDMHQRQGTYLQ